MAVVDMFSEFLDNLKIDNLAEISHKYGEITRALNKTFRDSESRISNSLQVGSFGRKTGIRGISDLDMLYILPDSKWSDYKNNGQGRLLKDTKDAVLEHYPRTKVRVDRLVVTVSYSNFQIEVQPVFQENDGSFNYPDTKNGGSWKITKPKEEMNAVSVLDEEKNRNLRRLCKMTRAWKNKHGVVMGGLLIDTLAYNFLNGTEAYDASGVSQCDKLICDFFEYLYGLPVQDRYIAPGSRQHVKVKKNFQRKAKKAYDLSLDAINSENNKNVNYKWKKVFGRPFPGAVEETQKSELESASTSWDNTEQFVEEFYFVDVRYHLRIECDVKQDGFMVQKLRYMISKNIPLLTHKSLYFKVVENEAPKPYRIFWKVLNRGPEARKRNDIRGQIINDSGFNSITEKTSFSGNHIVECYVVKGNVVVARDFIDVPITKNG